MRFRPVYWYVVSSFLCVLVSGTTVHARIEMRFSGGLQAKDDRSGQAVRIVATGDEYTLQVVTDQEVDPSSVFITGLHDHDDFEVAQGGTARSMTMINGKTSSTVTHSFYVRPRQVGAYVWGPLKVEGNVVSDAAITVRVLEPASYDHFAGKKGAARQALKCALVVDAHEVFVGQPLTLTVVVEDDGNVLERGLQPPSFGDFKAEQLGQARVEQKIVNGQVKVVTEQAYRLTAAAPGTYTIGAAAAHFLVPDAEDDGLQFGGVFGSFFGPQGKKRVVRSNQMVVGVKPLPLSTEPVDGVGSFERFEARVDKTVVELNEPFSFSLTLTGVGNFDAITAPVVDLGPAVSVYPSGSRLTAPQSGVVFDYIIQIEEAGEHVLPPLSFCYFDVATAQYKKLFSEQLAVTVKKAKVVTAAADVEQAPVAPAKAFDGPPVPLSDSGAPLPVLPWWWLLVSGALVLIFLLRTMLQRALRFLGRKIGVIDGARAQQALVKSLVTGQDVGSLYHFFVHALAGAWKLAPEQIDGEAVYAYTAGWQWSEERRTAFALYITQLGQAAFAPLTLREAVKTELLDKTLYWYELMVGEIKERS